MSRPSLGEHINNSGDPEEHR